MVLLDHMLNFSNVYDPVVISESIAVRTGKDKIVVMEEWDNLLANGILVKKDYQSSIERDQVDAVKQEVYKYLESKNVTLDHLTEHITSRINDQAIVLSSLVAIMGKKFSMDGSTSIGFVDGEWVHEPGPLCNDLVKGGLLFLNVSSSKKHSYHTFYFRTWPFDGVALLTNLIFKHLNIEGLSDEEWKVISLLLISRDLELEYQIVKTNTDLADSELREIVTVLRRRGLVTESYGRIVLNKGLKEPLVQYLKLSVFPKMKSEIVTKIKLKIGKSISNLLPFMLVKSICDRPESESLDPVTVKFVKRSDVSGYEQSLEDMKQLDLILDYKDNLVILVDVVKEVENWLKGSIKSSLVFIPARDAYFARATLQNMFSRCQEYVKIQDPYLGEETFDVLDYIPKETEIKLLTSTGIGVGEDLERVIRSVERMKAERRAKFHVLFIGNPNGDAPFHDRFIISKNACWNVGTSLKQIGKDKDTTIADITKQDKEELIERAFDNWWTMKAEDLSRNNLEKIDFQSWQKKHKSSSDEK